MSPQALNTADVAVVLAAHGERGGDRQNTGLAALAGDLVTSKAYHHVGAGVLNGDPDFRCALVAAQASGARQILVYPLFMSPGYFVDTKVPAVIADVGGLTPMHILPPLGLEPELVRIMLARAVARARATNLSPANATLMVVGHGSKSGAPASAIATRGFAAALRATRQFADVDAAFLEEAPFVADRLTAAKRPLVVVGYFFASGLHAAEDVPEAIAETKADAVYTGAVGAGAEITALIAAAVAKATG